ncbi:MAG TPA: cytochrome B5 [Bacteroidetes bacterium]|nr:cytochrome B5 [Bacteroidota bacterium]
MKIFTLEELKQYDGKSGRPAYIACDGKVYDVSGSFLWQNGEHMVTHMAGRDLSAELAHAPHGADLLERFPTVGILPAGES